jgi:GlpG protein
MQNDQIIPLRKPEPIQWRRVPVTLTTIGLSVIGFLLFTYDTELKLVRNFTYFNFEVVQRAIVYHPESGQWWRLLTPVFLHFGWLHVTFNGLWIWDLGGKIERAGGAVLLTTLILVSGIGSNWVQGVVAGPSLFGGMSGVVYAMLAYCGMLQYFYPALGLAMPRGLYVFMAAWLLLCLSGLVEVLGFGAIANGAHLGGCALGLAIGGLDVLRRRFRQVTVKVDH